MKIVELVRAYIKKVFHYCDTVDHGELARLMDPAYSKETFDISYPFCTEVSQIPWELSRRYWTTVYVVRGQTVRVSNDWYDTHVSRSRPLFTHYLLAKKIVAEGEVENVPEVVRPASRSRSQPKRTGSRARRNSRYRNSAIGNAQNLVVRNILSSLGQESFNEKDWAETKAYFSNRCAYCGKDGALIMEHVVPINRHFLGEHRLGNLVPSCQACNSAKRDLDFRDFLQDQPERIEKIEAYMESRNYVPLGENYQVKMVLEMAYEEVAAVAGRYVAILNELFPNEWEAPAVP